AAALVSAGTGFGGRAASDLTGDGRAPRDGRAVATGRSTVVASVGVIGSGGTAIPRAGGGGTLSATGDEVA
ncbi:MAG: hypothetical protein ACR2LU_00680, partial [Luteitalea sp.]